MYTQKGARGTEVIPNYTFWKDFPFLIKVNTYIMLYVLWIHNYFSLQDGFLFVISPCYKRSDKYQGL